MSWVPNWTKTLRALSDAAQPPLRISRLARQILALGPDELDELVNTIADARLLADPDLQESLAQMRRGEFTVLRIADEDGGVVGHLTDSEYDGFMNRDETGLGWPQ